MTPTEEKPLSEKIIEHNKLDRKCGFKHDCVDEIHKDVAEAVKKFLSHFTPKDKAWMGVEMFSPREIIDFAKKDFGRFDNHSCRNDTSPQVAQTLEDNHALCKCAHCRKHRKRMEKFKSVRDVCVNCRRTKEEHEWDESINSDDKDCEKFKEKKGCGKDVHSIFGWTKCGDSSGFRCPECDDEVGK